MSRRLPNKKVAELVDWAKGLGYEVGDKDGAGHVTLHHPSGVSLGIPTTMSESRTVDNTKAQLRRLIGASEEKPKAARYRHQRPVDGYSFTRNIPSRAVDEAYETITAVDTEIMLCDPRRHASKLLELAQRRLRCEEILRQNYRPVPPLPGH